MHPRLSTRARLGIVACSSIDERTCIDFWQSRFDAGQYAVGPGRGRALSLRAGPAAANCACRIAVPGCGSGHDVVHLAQAGFDVTGLDYAPAAVMRTRASAPEAGRQANVAQADVLAWSPLAPFDAVYEQTCLCALHPDHWVAYAKATACMAAPGRAPVRTLRADGAARRRAKGSIDGPPYHCDINAMRALFDASKVDVAQATIRARTAPTGVLRDRHGDRAEIGTYPITTPVASFRAF